MSSTNLPHNLQPQGQPLPYGQPSHEDMQKMMSQYQQSALSGGANFQGGHLAKGAFHQDQISGAAGGLSGTHQSSA